MYFEFLNNTTYEYLNIVHNDFIYINIYDTLNFCMQILIHGAIANNTAICYTSVGNVKYLIISLIIL